MSAAPFRLKTGGRIARERPLSFTFDGRRFEGFAGDTLASALLAHGVATVARSFKFHRRRGIYTASSDEPNALVSLGGGGRHEPNARATDTELFDGLAARSQNCWPSVNFDLMAVNGWFAPILKAGFYYKTFMGPTRGAWRVYEHVIRRAAGLGKATLQRDPDTYEHGHLFCDVLVAGAGPAGLAAALAAGRAGARVIVCEQQPRTGGQLLDQPADGPGDDWRRRIMDELAGLATVRIMTRTSVFGAYDGGTFGLIERLFDHVREPPGRQPRQRSWTLRCGHAVIATGATERAIVFANNDRPGIMLASAIGSMINRYAVLPGRAVVLFTNNDSAYDVACDAARAGAAVTLVDVRRQPPAKRSGRCRDAGVAIIAGHGVIAAAGRKSVSGVHIAPVDASDDTRFLACDLLGVSGGWTPAVHLMSHRGARPLYDEGLACFVPGDMSPGQSAAGACAGAFALSACIAQGLAAGREAAGLCGFARTRKPLRTSIEIDDAWEMPIEPYWASPVNGRTKSAPRFVDLQNDVTISDIELAHREGFVSLEHLKRYTTLGMGTDQGKTSNVAALALMAGLRGCAVSDVGTTTFRPPYMPVAIGALAGPRVGPRLQPRRLSPMHDWHRDHGAVYIQAGLWERPWYYPGPGESLEQCYIREARQTRKTVGLTDVSPLGKIDVQGPDAAEFLNRVYINGWKKLAVGKARYGVMLREDGIVADDGTTSRLADEHYFMTTTTANAGAVMARLEFLLQTAWPDLKVHVTSVSDQWAGMAVAGPRSRDLLAGLIRDVDFSAEGLPFMGLAHGSVRAIPVRILRVSYSGELAYELYCPAGFGHELWDRVFGAGADFDLVVYGLEAMGTMRIEKGHVAGPEIDGRTSAGDLGLGRMASTKKPFIGSVLMRRDGLRDASRPALVGIRPVERTQRLSAGAILCEPGRHEGHGIGHVSSITFSPQMGCDIALALVSGGLAREGDIVDAVFSMRDETVAVRIVNPVFFDPGGERLRG